MSSCAVVKACLCPISNRTGTVFFLSRKGQFENAALTGGGEQVPCMNTTDRYELGRYQGKRVVHLVYEITREALKNGPLA